MKKILKFLFTLVLIFLISFIVVKFSDKYNIKISKKNIECTIVTKGCENAKALAYNNDKIYIAYKNYVKLIDVEGKEQIIYKDNDEIEDVECYKDSLLIISGNKLSKYNMDERKEEVILINIPFSGNNIERKLVVNGDDVYISIGALSNSGIKEDGTIEDTTKMDDNVINNATVYKLSLVDKKLTRFATGIRGISGIDVTNEGKIYAVFSGMLSEGNRPIYRDKDYIYLLEKSYWYGWPDFSGGDYINSPRFAKDELIKPIMDKPFSKVVSGPKYVGDSVDSIKELAIDKEGSLLPKDSMVFWDKCNNSIVGIVDNKAKVEILKLLDKSIIEDIIYCNGDFLVLDSEVGGIYRLHEKVGILKFKLPYVIEIYIYILIMLIVGVVILKIRKSNNKVY